MSKLSCNVVKDLLALYLDGICSEESKRLVEEHLESCDGCKAFLEEIKVKETEGNNVSEPVQFFRKAKKYVDSRYRLAFKIALAFAAIIILYGISDSSHVPSILTYVSVPVLAVTFFLVQPAEQNKEWKYNWMQIVSAVVSIFLPVFQFIFVHQTFLVLENPGDERIWKIFRMEPYQLGPMAAKIYLTCVIIQVILLIAYYYVGKAKKQGFLIGQNLSWLGIGLGLQFQDLLFNMSAPEGFIQMSVQIMGIMFAECLILFLCNLVYVKRKSHKWLKE